MSIAKEVSKRATCDRLHVGAVVVKDKRIVSTGYNGSVPGLPHCDVEGHLIENDHCVRTVHGEVNAILQAAKYGISVYRADIYVTHSPCRECFKEIVSSGIKKIVIGELYRWNDIVDWSEDASIELIYSNGKRVLK